MRKIIFAMVAMLAIGGMLFAEPAEGVVSYNGSTAVTSATGSEGAKLTVSLDLKGTEADYIEVGFTQTTVNDSTTTSPTEKINATLTVGDTGEATNANDAVNVYWIIRTATNLDVKLTIPAAMSGDSLTIPWKATTGTPNGTGGVSAGKEIDDNNIAVKIADHTGTNYNTKGSIPLTISTDGLASAATSQSSVSGTIVVTIATDNG